MSLPLSEHLGSVAARVKGAAHLLLGLDFDGTLAPIVDDPTEARLSPSTREIVKAIAAQKDTTVAIVSGQGLRDVQRRIDIEGLIYAGNHGLEISGPQMTFLEPGAARMQKTLGWLAAALAKGLVDVNGAIVEYKTLTISVHCRQVVPSEREVVFRHVHAAASIVPNRFRIGLGKLVYNVCPQVDWHKGAAMRWIADRLNKQHVLMIYIGDDLTDEDAFRSLTDGITVKVGEPAGTAANYCLDDPASVHSFLAWLAAIDKQGGQS